MTQPKTDLTNVRNTVDKANGLPNPHYVDPEVYNGENTRCCLRNGPVWQ